MKKDKIIGTFTVSSKERIDMFRIHLFENSIRFDEDFAEGMVKINGLPEKIIKLSNKWKKRKLKDRKAFYEVINALSEYENELMKYYFKENDLDEEGRYLEPLLIDTFDKDITKEENMKIYISLKKNGRLKKITKKEFEKNIKNKEVIDYYIENYTKEKVNYYTYKATKDDKITDCYILTKNNKPIIGFEK